MADKIRTYPVRRFDILPQPDNFTCGPTCLHGVLRYWGDPISLEGVIAGTPSLAGGGTLAVMLGIFALTRGYRVRIYTYNLEVFDPSWFQPGIDVAAKLREQAAIKRHNNRLLTATDCYLEFLAMGGELRYRELDSALLAKFQRRGLPILTGLSSTYLYKDRRELPSTEPDDVRGEPTGHFVVLTGWDATHRLISVADPLNPNPISADQFYKMPISRVVGAIMLGILTYDANLMIIEPRDHAKETKSSV